MRGGVSQALLSGLDTVSSSPHAWGCFLDDGLREGDPIVFPTCVGVFLAIHGGYTVSIGLPHMRGGVS